jgi:hypothetical protein
MARKRRPRSHVAKSATSKLDVARFERGTLDLTIEAQRAAYREKLVREAGAFLYAMIMIARDDEADAASVEHLAAFLKRHRLWDDAQDVYTEAVDAELREHHATLGPKLQKATIAAGNRAPDAEDDTDPRNLVLADETRKHQVSVIGDLSTAARQRLHEQLRRRGVRAAEASRILGESPDAARKRRKRARR